MTDTVINTAPIKWAQRSDSLYVTIALQDVSEETINISDEELHFKGKSGEKNYEVNITFFKPVNGKDSTYKVHPRSVHLHIMKEDIKDDGDEDEVFWPRLLKDKALEKNQVKIDWDRYVDEDEEEDGFDMSGMEGAQGMGGMPGMGGPGGAGGMDMEALMKQMGNMGGATPGGMPDDDDDDDSDDSDLPDLEDA
mmetsp:Transcript_41714/g.61259  ORF Transcript_41714/g.61259 Transcript_41714/m.61259 type:complete len:194 (+) Transcript_41714:107-688(+)|eukprot:CAMPEP_0195519410 /NCGR_PEP_ID=MMETSP0794_2-20130614/14697_1 /TAXON_ID=515487 /ORGANISM="Stephanopyxis turris, Strain CCMP 815" /LENGTH=193 /DNA_ID=CAMNT_0040648555 /DNA_START=91 /DNA_END=672 /DNA_ORIENTATION=+